jgi:hypothetical protein
LSQVHQSGVGSLTESAMSAVLSLEETFPARLLQLAGGGGRDESAG